MREIKFRAFQDGGMVSQSMNNNYALYRFFGFIHEGAPAMQYTGLKDKNGVTEVYEGDIISTDGLIIGNQYENPKALETRTNLLIQGFGTENWCDTNKEAMERGCKYA